MGVKELALIQWSGKLAGNGCIPGLPSVIVKIKSGGQGSWRETSNRRFCRKGNGEDEVVEETRLRVRT